MIKLVKAALASFVTAVVCYYCGIFLGFEDFSFAWVLNFSLMAWYTYLDSLFNWQYKSSYFSSRSWENNGAIYTYFGVHFYRKLLVWVGWESIRRKELKLDRSRKAIAKAEYKSRSSEMGHTLIFLIVLSVTIILAETLREALWLLVLNVLLNLYPVMVQRYNRPRYRRLLQMMGKTTSEA